MFKIGDKVKVNSNYKYHEAYEGMEGVVIRIEMRFDYPYYIRFKEKDEDFDLFTRFELELVK